MVGAVPTPAYAEATSLVVDQVSAPYRSTTSLTATVTPAVAGLSVDFSLGASSLGPAQTDSNGVATFTNVDLGTRSVNTYSDAISATLPAQDIYETSSDTA